jgi:hypothetical protein
LVFFPYMADSFALVRLCRPGVAMQIRVRRWSLKRHSPE